jgi:hypothetical protein
MSALLITISVLIVLILLVIIVRNNTMYYDDFDDEVTTTHTTTTTTTNNDSINIGLNVNGVPVVGMLQRQWENGQPFVIDPVDGDKMWLNTKDDLYEDGANKIWGLN